MRKPGFTLPNPSLRREGLGRGKRVHQLRNYQEEKANES
jgi:hypothetical protein